MVCAIERKQAVQHIVHEVKETSMRRQRKEAMRSAELWKPGLGVRHPRKDGEKSRYYKSESADERSNKEKRKS